MKKEQFNKLKVGDVITRGKKRLGTPRKVLRTSGIDGNTTGITLEQIGYSIYGNPKKSRTVAYLECDCGFFRKL
jgi:hypothetical protein